MSRYYLKNKRNPTDIIEPYFICLDEKEIKKRLSNVKEIIKKQVNISNATALELGIITLFAPRNNAQEITREVIGLYGTITARISKKMETTLYLVLKAMIDAYFDDKKEYLEMTKMLDNYTTIESTERFVSLDIANNEIAELKKIIEEKEKSANERIVELESKIKDLETQLNNSK